MRLLLLAVVAPFLAAGCNSAGPLVDAAPVSSAGLTLTADKDAYARGETARLVLRNGGAATATTGVLECAQFERWTGSAWETSPDGNDRACILLAAIVAPGEILTGSVPIDVSAGSYRLTQSVSVEGAGTSVDVSTASFRVGG